MLDAIRIRRHVLDELVAHALRDAPAECCGLMVGARGLVDESVPTANLSDDPSRYLVDPKAHIAVNRSIRGTGREVLGAYHSHPHSPAVPSARDLSEASYPEFVYTIVSLAVDGHPDVRGYRIARGHFEPVLLVLVP